MTNETIFIIKLISRKSTNREFTILIYKKVKKNKVLQIHLQNFLIYDIM